MPHKASGIAMVLNYGSSHCTGADNQYRSTTQVIATSILLLAIVVLGSD